MYFSNRELDAFASLEGEKSRQPLIYPMFPDWVDVPSVCKLIKLTKRRGKKNEKEKKNIQLPFTLKCRREVFLGGYKDLFYKTNLLFELFWRAFSRLSCVI